MSGAAQWVVFNWIWIAAIVGILAFHGLTIYVTIHATIWHRRRVLDLVGAAELRAMNRDLRNKLAEQARYAAELERELGDYHAYRIVVEGATVKLGADVPEQRIRRVAT